MTDRWVFHIDMDAFFASVEQLTRPTLRDRPVLVGGTNGRGVVAGCSYEAREFGVHSAMPMGQARRLAGYRAITVRPRGVVYKTVSRAVMRILHAECDVVEQLSIDEAFFTVEALDGASPEAVQQWAQKLRARIREAVDLPASVGIGSGKQYAKIASGLAKPDGVHVIPHQIQQELMGPLSVRKLWGVGPVAGARLNAAGVETIADLAALPQQEAEELLGRANGFSLWTLAQGHDDRPVAPRAVAKQISSEHTMAIDVTTLAAAEKELEKAFDSAFQRLTKDGRSARTVTVKSKLSSFQQFTRSATLPTATLQRDELWELARTLVIDPAQHGALRLIGCSFSGLERFPQPALFAPPTAATYRSHTRTHVNVADESDEGQWDEFEVGAAGAGTGELGATFASTGMALTPAEDSSNQWPTSADVYHPDFGHGWVQGSGHNVVTVRFETRTTGPGRIHNFAIDDDQLVVADPLDSLDWPAELLN